jgi:hypothetical protein
MNTFNRLFLAILGLGLAFGGVVLAVESVFVLLDRQAWLINRGAWDRGLESATWANQIVFAVIIAVGVVGTLLLLSQLIPRKRRDYKLDSPTKEHKLSIDRDGLADLLSRAATTDSVTHADCELKRRKAVVYVTPGVNADHDKVREESKAQADNVMQRLVPRRRLRTVIRIEEAQ